MMAPGIIPHLLKKQSDNHLVVDLMRITEQLSGTLFSMPLPREAIVKIMTGQIKVIIGINLDRLVDVFTENGLKTRWLSRKETAKIKSYAKQMQYVICKNKAIGMILNDGQEAIISWGIITKIAFDSIIPSNLAASITTSQSPA